MARGRCISLLLSMMLAPALPVTGQETVRPDIRIGIEAGGALSAVMTSIPVFAGGPECGVFEQASGATLWGGARLHLASLFEPGLGALVRVGALRTATRGTTSPTDPLVIYDDETDAMVDVPRVYAVELDESRIEAAFMLAWSPQPQITLFGGPWIGARMSSSVRQLEQITGGEVRYEKQLSERPIIAATPIAPTTLVGGLGLGLAYALPIGDRLRVEPTISFDLSLLPSIEGGSWRELRGMLVLPITYAIGSSGIAPPPIVEAASSRSGPSASIDLAALNDNGSREPSARITVFETLRRARAPIASAVLFEENSAALPQQYRERTAADADGFDPDSIAVADLDGLVPRSLDVLGLRLRRSTGARVALVPSTSSGEAPWLGFARAEAVRSYLEQIWKIDRSRIEIRPRTTSKRQRKSAPPGVTIVTEPRDLLAAYAAELPEREIEPPVVHLEPRYAADAGVASATTTLMYDGREIGRYEGSADRSEAQLRWQIDPHRLDRETMLVVELHVSDALGRDTVATARLPIRLEREVRIIERSIVGRGDTERTVATLYSGIPDLSQRNLSAIDQLVRDLRRDARITVDGSDAVRAEIVRRLALAGRRDVSVRSGAVPPVAAESRSGRSRVRIAIEQPFR